MFITNFDFVQELKTAFADYSGLFRRPVSDYTEKICPFI